MIEIYNKGKEGTSFPQLIAVNGVRSDNLKYLCRLIDCHGVDMLNNAKNRVYSNDLKQTILNEVLIKNQSIKSNAIKYGLSSAGMLLNWIKSYQENG